MDDHSLLLGDQIENSIRLCTQHIGMLYGFRGRRLEESELSKRSLLELNLLTSPFLFYLSKSRLNVSNEICSSLINALLLFKTSNGAFDNSKLKIIRNRGNAFDTALTTLNLINIGESCMDSTIKDSNQTDIYEAVKWLSTYITVLGQKKDEINLDGLISAYTILQVAGMFEDRSQIKIVVEKLSPLRFLSEITRCDTSNNSICKDIIHPLAVRILIELANLSGHDHFYKLARTTLENQAKYFEELMKFIIEGKTSRFTNKKIDLGYCSLWAYNAIQLHNYLNIPDLLEIASALLRLTSDIVIEAQTNQDQLMPQYFNLKTGTYEGLANAYYIRFFLDAAELSKSYISCSSKTLPNLKVQDLEVKNLVHLKSARYQA